jgi:hypothetical protein
MATKKTKLTGHVHWKNLIDNEKVKKIADKHGVFLIVIKRLSPLKKKKGKTYDFVAYLHGEGSDYLGKFIHKTTCEWEEV